MTIQFKRLILISLICFSSWASAKELSELVERNPEQALTKINSQLEQDPNNEEALFLRARIYQQKGNFVEAKRIYRQLIKQAPMQPEPYINLAAILSDQGNTKEAQKILIKGLNGHESYATIYKNLKAINGRLAAMAYQEALNQKSNSSEKVTLQTSKLIVTPEPVIKEVVKEVVKKVEVVKVKEVPVEIIKEVIKEVKVPVEVVKEVIKEVKVPVEVIKEVVKIKEVPVEVIKEVVKEVRVPVEVVKEVSNPENTALALKTNTKVNKIPAIEEGVPDLSGQVRDWAQSWSDRDVTKYTSFYVKNYSPKQGLSHRGWVRDRDIKIGGKKYIDVKVSDIQQEVQLKGQQIDVIFKQTYRSNTVNDTITKRLRFANQSGDWKIVQERVIGR